MEASNSQRIETKICEAHGEYQATCMDLQLINRVREIWSTCPECTEERKQQEDEQERQEKERAEAARLEKMFDRAGIPLRFRTRSFDNYICDNASQQRAKKSAQDYADDFPEACRTGRSMIFTGKTGTGKTHLSNAIANQILRAGGSAYFGSVREVVGMVKATWSRNSERTEREVIQNFIDVHLLIIDEIGVQFESETEKLVLFDIINGRYENLRPTIVLSNFPVDSSEGSSIRKVLGDRIIDRLREGGGKVVSFDWASNRGK